MKIVTIVGARPQFVKAAAFSRNLRQHPDIQEVIVHTGQHFDANMSDVFFDEMDIPKPKYILNINNLSHGAMTGRMLEEIEKILLTEQPDVVLVYGDTNSTLAGALAAKKIHLKIAHVESGLRSFNMQMPEEINRILTDRISDYLFCPTQNAVENLTTEGIINGKNNINVTPTGDIMYDAFLHYQKQANSSNILEINQLESNNYALVTIHRQENTDSLEALKCILEALEDINKTLPIVLPLHPRTQNILKKHGLQTSFKIIDPVGYIDMIQLLSNCKIVLTDSGGLQKEAYFVKKPCITLREQTEWVELVQVGANQLTGADKTKILNAFEHFSTTAVSFEQSLYGNGNTAAVILAQLLA
jgi:UDP-GlcNAc3NAcA epimerase